ncbi:J domain-containing protein [Methylocystis sp.]|uniref:J domain-containing protein n=1 Tax=Methylocystis sp. TaxID=1911079 RepID=UPI003DA554EB
MSSTDPYAILGVPRSATMAEIRSAYRRRAKKLHPDNKRTGSHEAFIQLSAALEYVEARFSQAESPRARAAGGGRRSAGPSGRRPPPPPREETFDEFMARTRGDRERFAQEQEEYFRRMHAQAPFQLLWWRLRDAFQTAVRDLAKAFGAQQ